MGIQRRGYKADRSSPSNNLKTITPGDTELDPYPLAVLVATDGVVAWTNQDDSTESETLPAGLVLSFQPKKILGTTTATVLGFYD